ncbi:MULTISPECIES: HoxN/HupN/NixA family nickel/cobalt transporter [Brevibacterium]|uniref:Nickel/cobalt efflux system n=1 Tax=Brevibacterium ammoniilyticum TaxID=1046555 RepID=A0ABP9U779_9MICO
MSVTADETTTTRPLTRRPWTTKFPFAVITTLAVVGVCLVFASTSGIAPIAAWGLAATAVLLGARHAFDADHIAVIDNVTRRLATAEQSQPMPRDQSPPANHGSDSANPGSGPANSGRAPFTNPHRARLEGGAVGFWFALGHSSVVIVTAAFVTAGAGVARSLVISEDSDLREVLGMWGLLFATSVVAVFGIVNLVAFIRLLRSDVGTDGTGGTASATRGPLITVFSQLIGTVDRPARMYPIGLLFGLGFDTAATIGLMIAAGTTAASTSPLLALSLPLLFAAGMAACDTGDSVMMARLYRWAAGDGGRFRRYNLVVTGLSVLVAALVVIAGFAEAGAETQLFRLPSVDTEYVGFAATGLFILIAMLALVAARKRTRTPVAAK